MEEAIEWIKRCPNSHNERERKRDPPAVRTGNFGASEAVAHHRRLGEQTAPKH